MNNNRRAEIRKANHDEVPPLIDENCTILMLGSMLSPKSAQARFYYAHPQNRFWSVLSRIFDNLPIDGNKARKELALKNNIALWDVISSCNIVGAADSTITDVEYNDITGLLCAYPKITRVFTTGGKAHELLMRYNKTANNQIIANAVRLPSTSPLNCAMSLNKLVAVYSAALHAE